MPPNARFDTAPCPLAHLRTHHHTRRTDLDPAAVISDIQALSADLPVDCRPIAVLAYLNRLTNEGGQQADGQLGNPIRTAESLARDAALLAAGVADWDGNFPKLLRALGTATETLAEAIGAAADIAIRRASDPAAPGAWEDLADQAAGAYDALIGATTLLTASQGPSPLARLRAS